MFHWYGFILGIAVVTGYLLAGKKAKQAGIGQEIFDKLILATLLGGIIGARLWHVTTDWYLYIENPVAVLYFWQGGLSIFGVILGGLLALWLAQKRFFSNVSFLKLLDSIAFGLPVGQGIGRLGNYVNQELYGLPTNLPWGIYIDEINRAVGFEQFTYFHPLFIYEALLVIVGWFTLRWLEKNTQWKIGSGKFFGWYVIYYLVIRFFLDFIRLQKGSLWFGLGINQWAIVAVLFIYFLKRVKRSSKLYN